MRELIGAKQEDGRPQRIGKVTQTETLKFNILSNETPGRVTLVINDVIIQIYYEKENNEGAVNESHLYSNQRKGSLF